jgi:hypothetical protein
MTDSNRESTKNVRLLLDNVMKFAYFATKSAISQKNTNRMKTLILSIRKLESVAFIFSVVLISLVFSTIRTSAQQKNKISDRIAMELANKPMTQDLTVWIFFTNKGQSGEMENEFAKIQLPDNALKRRSKTFKKNETLVTWYDVPVYDEYVSEIETLLVRKRHCSKWLNAISAEIKPSNLYAIASLDFVKKIELLAKGTIPENQYFPELSSTSKTKNRSAKDLNYGDSYNQNHQIRVTDLHNAGLTGQGVIICMMDAGYNNLAHNSLQHLNILGTWDFVNNNINVGDEDDFGSGVHGTLTLSALAGYKPDSLIGPAYAANFILTKTENTESETQVEEDNWIAAMEWAETNFGPDITSTSLGYIDFDNGFAYTPDDLDGNTAAITIAGDIAASLGILVVNSAGNSGPYPTSLGAPADGDSVLAIGAVTPWGEIAGFSSRGPTGDGRIKPEVVAQGVQVVSASPWNNSYVYPNGTSLSCPLVAGAAALLIEAFPEATNMQIFETLKITASQSYEPNNNYGWGIINAWAAYNYLNGKPHIVHKPIWYAFDFQDWYPIECKVLSITNTTSDIVRLTYRINNGSWGNILMTNSENNNYLANIPGVHNEAIVYYYIYAENNLGSVTMPENAPDSVLSFLVIHTSIGEQNFTENIFINPNPAKNQLFIQSTTADVLASVEIMNTVGQTLQHVKNLASGASINITDLSSGTYFARVKTATRVVLLKFVKQE